MRGERLSYAVSEKTFERITFGEVKAAIGKAPGPTGMVAEILKAAGDVGIQWMTDLCNAVVVEGKIPDDWKKSWMMCTKAKVMH